MRIAFVYNKGRPASFAGRSYDMGNDGGSEGSMVQYAFALAEMGHKVRVYIPEVEPHEHRNVEWRSIEDTARFGEIFDVVIAQRFPGALKGMLAPVKALFCHDPEIPEITAYVNSGDIQLVIVVSEHQKKRFQHQHPIDESLYLVSNSGIVWSNYDRFNDKVKGRCIYCSVPERGLGALGNIWPIIKSQLPWATLHVTGSLELWGIHRPINEQSQIVEIQHQPGVTYLGFISREQLIKEQLQSQILLLPGSELSPEMCCMSAMECAAARNALIVTDLCALPERVIEDKTGYVVPRVGDWQDDFASVAVNLMQDPRLGRMQIAAQEVERVHDYTVLAKQWTERFEAELNA